MEFSRKPTRAMAINVRITADQKALLTELAKLLNVGGQSDVLRAALDYYLTHSPEAKAALKVLKVTKPSLGE